MIPLLCPLEFPCFQVIMSKYYGTAPHVPSNHCVSHFSDDVHNNWQANALIYVITDNLLKCLGTSCQIHLAQERQFPEHIATHQFENDHESGCSNPQGPFLVEV